MTHASMNKSPMQIIVKTRQSDSEVHFITISEKEGKFHANVHKENKRKGELCLAHQDSVNSSIDHWLSGC